MNKPAAQALDTWRKRDGVTRAKGWVFPQKKNEGKRLKTIKAPWQRLRKLCDLEDVKFHDLRHTCAANLAMADVSIHKIAGLLGHSNIQMTMRYAKLAPKHLTETDVLADLFGSEKGAK